ncbi:MAG: hypothetical protein IAE89_04400 [Anaerolineae bacterium]|nr:hypothetical protein [Anaerolineae bacterium]
MFAKHFKITSDVNLEALHEELTAAYSNVKGLSRDIDDWQVFFLEEPTSEELEGVLAIINAHDASVKSTNQKELEALHELRRQFLNAPLDIEALEANEAGWRQLAEHVIWLEREVARLVS